MTRIQHIRDAISITLLRSGLLSVRSIGWWIGLKAHETFYGYTTNRVDHSILS